MESPQRRRIEVAITKVLPPNDSDSRCQVHAPASGRLQPSRAQSREESDPEVQHRRDHEANPIATAAGHDVQRSLDQLHPKPRRKPAIIIERLINNLKYFSPHHEPSMKERKSFFFFKLLRLTELASEGESDL
jgi:hypothetical protein